MENEVIVFVTVTFLGENRNRTQEMDNKKEVALKVENIILKSVRARLKLFSVLTQSDDLIIIPTFLPDLICAPTKEILISSCGFNCLIWVAHGSSNPDVTALNIMMVVDCGKWKPGRRFYRSCLWRQGSQ